MKLKVKEITVFAMLGALIFALKKVMEFAPNVHLVGVFIIAITVVYGKKALYPLYIYFSGSLEEWNEINVDENWCEECVVYYNYVD